MKVLHVSHTATVSGAEHSLLALMRSMPRAAEAGVACPSGDLSDRLAREGFATHRMPGTAGSLRLHPLHTPRAAAELMAAAVSLARTARRERATVLHANSVRAGIVTALARGLGAPPAVVHIRDVLPEGRSSALIARLIDRNARLVAISRYVAAGFPSKTPAEVIDNPIEPGRFARPPERLRAELGLEADAPVLLLAGQITHWKGHDTIIRALPRIRTEHPGAQLLIAGEVLFASSATRFDNTTYVEGLHAMVAELGLGGAVRFLGQRNDVPELLAAADVVVAPSIAEPFGRVIAEAMVAGTAVVATGSGGPPEFVEDGRTGLLVQPGDPDAWAVAIGRLLGDRELRDRLAAAGRASATARFDPGLHAERMLHVFAEAQR
jgi:glycosyltransferase involved in cell wall biosynthesis